MLDPLDALAFLAGCLLGIAGFGLVTFLFIWGGF
jgi:hypothetical protein